MPTIFDKERNDERTVEKAISKALAGRATDVVLTDTSTGTKYRLIITDGDLLLEEV